MPAWRRDLPDLKSISRVRLRRKEAGDFYDYEEDEEYYEDDAYEAYEQDAGEKAEAEEVRRRRDNRV